ncbi:MAG: DegT/DnrJ/EryC1/StrS family aminotransferase [Oligoflexales bacterium]
MAFVEDCARIYKDVYQTDQWIALHEPWFGGREKEYVLDCVQTRWVSSVGAYVDRFQKELAEYTGAPFCIPTSSGTTALHLSLLGLEVGHNDLVICQDLTFVATAAAICHSGAEPLFLDVESQSMSLCPKTLERYLETQTTLDTKGIRRDLATQKRVAACMVMHTVGFAAQIQDIKNICENYQVLLLEDAAEALGSSVDNRMCGTWGQAGIYSFNGNKVMTAGGGGALVTHDETLAKKCHHLATTAKIPHPWKYEHDDIGFNYRMPNLNAALAVAQLENLDVILQKKKEQGQKILCELETCGYPVVYPPSGDWNFWFLMVRCPQEKQEEWIQNLAHMNVMARPLWQPVSSMKPYEKYPKPWQTTQSLRLSKEILCLPNGIPTHDSLK